jgi:hypothetical protein
MWSWFALGLACARVDTTCVPTDNALRFACTAARDGVWTFEGEGLQSTFSGSSVVTWGLPAGDYRWSFSAGGEGEVSTGPLPDWLTPTLAPIGSTDAFDAVFFPLSCGETATLLLVDPAGRVRWYEAAGMTTDDAGVVGAQWTDRDTALFGWGQTEIAEIAASGAELWRSSGFDRPLHHDVARGGRYVYALQADAVDGVIVDGLYVLEGGREVARWDLRDHVAVEGPGGPALFWNDWFPGAVDWSHANSVWSDGSRALLSLRWQNAVVSLDADPASATFGAIDWIVVGAPASLATDWVTDGSFYGQHHATPTATGFAVFDNRPIGVPSRAVTFDLDPGARRATETASWVLDRNCPIQGGAAPLPDGGMLVTCMAGSEISAFGAEDAVARWSMAPTCGSGPPAPGAQAVPRAQPVWLPHVTAL